MKIVEEPINKEPTTNEEPEAAAKDKGMEPHIETQSGDIVNSCKNDISQRISRLFRENLIYNMRIFAADSMDSEVHPTKSKEVVIVEVPINNSPKTDKEPEAFARDTDMEQQIESENILDNRKKDISQHIQTFAWKPHI